MQVQVLSDTPQKVQYNRAVNLYFSIRREMIMIMQNQDWLLNNLIECFNDNKKAIPFIKEKLQIINGKLYKYCPIYENEDIQYSIMNLENDNIYLSSISNFNDPFDSLCSFSIEDFAKRILENKLNQIP